MGYRDEPPPGRGAWMKTTAGYHSYPPRKPRYPGPRQVCRHCGLTAQTTDPRCPVCDCSYREPVLKRLFRRAG